MVYNFEMAANGSILTSGMPGMAHMAGINLLIFHQKKYDLQKSVPQKFETAWALGLK